MRNAIQSSVLSGYMPPWPPDTNYSRFRHERILSDQEIKTNQTFLALENLSQQYFGIQATTFLTVIFITLGVILGVVMFAITKSEIFTGLGFFIPLALGMNISSPISSWTYGLLLVLGVATAMVMGRRWIS